MIILSKNILFKPDNAVLESLGEAPSGEYVYKTNNLEAVKAANAEAQVETAGDNVVKELRKTLILAQDIDRNTAQKIRSKYSANSELGAIRTNNAEYKAFIEEVIAEHNAAKDALFSI
ncbi:hypothetical protein EBX31_00845 [bacterium]|nr:hypothetical protein [bacterium]